jgi:hypothetical protein
MCESNKDHKIDKGWSKSEFSTVQFGDARLNKRFLKMAASLCSNSQAPINQASEDDAAAKAAYRLFSNDKVTTKAVLAPHLEKVRKRASCEDRVFYIQDTTFINYDSHKKTKGLGPIGSKSFNTQGIIAHTTLAITKFGLPLGIADQQIWVRPQLDEDVEEDAEKEKLPAEKKESYRWIKSLQNCSEFFKQSKHQKIILGDREMDIHSFLVEAKNKSMNYVLRSKHNRLIESNNGQKINELVDNQQCSGSIQTTVTPSSHRAGRIAKLEVKFAPIQITAPANSPDKESISAWVVSAREVDIDTSKLKKNEKPLTWTLLTDVEVSSLEDAIERIDWYKMRWHIEVFHKILKSGCKVESCRLQTYGRLEKYITLFSVISWRIFWLVHINRTSPNEPASVVLTKLEISVLYTLKRFDTKLPKVEKLKVKHAILSIGNLGGHLNRRSDPSPGPTALWRGWQRLSDMAELLEGVNEKQKTDT